MGFRFPGDLGTEHDFWEALKAGRDLITEIPADRWATSELQHGTRAEPGRSITFAAGVLSRADEFDAEFFGISPREAAWLDPQQRLLLELAWEAMENAAVPPSSLAGSNCAVYVGISSLDYGTRVLDDLPSLTGHMMTGNTLSVAANRLSYVFDLHGPSLAVDTACSSSLVALHHACVALQTGQTATALVGGVNMLMHPYPFVGFTKASMLSADGRSKAFDASGDGYVRSEGGAVLLLKTLAQAQADGDEIHAVIRASGVNADGARKTGITIPSRDGQVELMRAVLARSGLAAGDIDFIEAHGTGTSVGDPIEAGAIGEVYGADRSSPLPIGSVKANLGHLEAASGMAGLVKTVIALRQRALPKGLHVVTPNPRIDFTTLNLALLDDYRPIVPRNGRSLVAGINSFGFGGANAHVLLEAAQQQAPQNEASVAPATLPPLFLSAKNDEALRAQAAQYAELLRGDTLDDAAFYDVAGTRAHYRDRLAKRLVCHAGSRAEIAEALSAFSRSEPVAAVVTEDAPTDAGAVAFVYSGNGAQWVGMGRHLYAESARFKELVVDLDARMRPLLGFSLVDELFADEPAARMDDTVVAQPLLFAVQVASTIMLREQGIAPAAVTGHSVGEVAAAWAAGALSLDQAIRVIVQRSAAQGTTRGTGRMAAAALSEHDALVAIAETRCKDVVIAGINSPGNVTLSGSLDELKRIEAHLRPSAVFFRVLDLDYAFHSHYMDPVQAMLTDSLHNLQPQTADDAVFVSTVTASVLSGTELDADYWWRNVREPVKFGEAIKVMAERDCRVFIEVGPNAILQRYISESLDGAAVKGKVLPFLRRKDDGLARLRETVLRAQLLAKSPNLGIYFPHPAKRARLPNYPWQRMRHWHPATSEGRRAILSRREHPVLGWPLYDGHAWENVVDVTTLPWLQDHQVGGAVVFPGAGYIEMALAAAKQWLGSEQERFLLEEIDILAPMVFDEGQARTLRFSLNARDGGFVIKSKPRLAGDEWTLHASGRILAATKGNPQASIAAPVAITRTLDAAQHYNLTQSIGLHYGPAFQGFGRAQGDAHSLSVALALPAQLQEELGDYVLHPALLDVCYQSLVNFFADEIGAGRGRAFLPIKTGRLDVFAQTVPHTFRVHLKRFSVRSALADVELFDANGQLVVRLANCRFRAAPLVQGSGDHVGLWQTVPRLAPHAADTTPLSMSVGALADATTQALSDNDAARQAWFGENLPLFEALVVAFTYEAMVSGIDPSVLDASPYGRWARNLLESESLIAYRNGEWELAASADLPPAQEIWNLLLTQSPQSLPQLLMAGRVGRHLPQILSGELPPAQFWQELANMPAVEAQLDSDPVYAGATQGIEHTLALIAQSRSKQRPLRILEVATGYSDVARQFAMRHNEGGLHYVLALSDEHAYGRHQAELAELDNLTLAQLDTDWNLQAETPLPAQYDVVILRHSLSLAAQPQYALEKLRRQMAADGLLVVAERYADLSADFIEGLRPHWWHDVPGQENGVQSSLTSPADWQQFIERAGFADVRPVAETAAAGAERGAYLLLASNAGVTQVEQPVAAQSWQFWVGGESTLVAERVCAHLISQGQQAECVTDVEQVLHDGAQNIVYLRGWRTAVDTASNTVSDLLDVLPALARSARPPKLWVMTRGGALATDLPEHYEANPAQAALWGAVRVAMNEYPDLPATLLDVALDLGHDAAIGRLCNELLHPDGINEIILTDDARLSLTWQPRAQKHHAAAGNVERFRLDFKVPGQLRNLQWFEAQPKQLAADEVEVQTKAAGLNFRDVMYLMGLLPDEAVENGFAGASLGLEFAGVVTRVGADVSDVQPGDEVMGFGSSCFSSHVVTRRDAIAIKPAHWNFASAATVPTVFFTVYYALKHLADLCEGERVLIHGGAGGVGIAAIQLARHLGAEVFATAGSDEKRDFVHLLGADHVFDSRSLDFVDDIMAATNGEGVDVVLNSLAGEAVRRNFSVLKPFGRFLELGKRDFYENTPIGLRPFKDNISYFGIDADQLLTGRPKLAGKLFADVMALFHDDVLSPLPYRTFSVPKIVDAFRTMQQARHIGKVVVAIDQLPEAIEAATEHKQALETDATWLVTGGLSGFGLASAQWLAQQGVKNLVLVSRRGTNTPGAQEAIAAMQTLGAHVEAIACDITNRAAVDDVIRHISQTLPPLKGVLHAAMVIDDRLIANLDAQAIDAVLKPKLEGAWHLHEATAAVPLDHFVLYSSITTSIGNPGQANYVAANAGLEGLAELRRSLGLPATSIGWGPIGDVGYLTRNTAVRDALEQRLGRAPLSTAQALATLGQLLGSASTGETVCAANFEWSTLSRLLAPATRFAALDATKQSAASEQMEGDFRSIIAGKSPAEVHQLVSQQVAHEVAGILGISEERIPHEQSLHDLGLDSLMAVELAMGLEQRVGVRLPIMMLNDAPTIAKVAMKVTAQLAGSDEQKEEGTDMLVEDFIRKHGEDISQEDRARMNAETERMSAEGVRLTA